MSSLQAEHKATSSGSLISGEGLSPSCKGVDGGIFLFLRFNLFNNIAIHCILRGEYPNICIYTFYNIPALPC